MKKVVHQALPADLDAQEEFVRTQLADKHQGAFQYSKIHNRAMLLEAFEVRKADFQLLHATITRLVSKGVIDRTEVETRKTERYIGSGFCNPANRQVTLRLHDAVSSSSP